MHSLNSFVSNSSMRVLKWIGATGTSGPSRSSVPLISFTASHSFFSCSGFIRSP